MIRKLSEREARLVAWTEPVTGEAVRTVRARLVQHAAEQKALNTLEARLRTRLPALVHSLMREAETPIRALLEQELARLRNATRIIVRMHPGQRALFAQLASEVETSLEPVFDDTLAPDDVLLESELGDIDARLSTRISAFVEALLQPETSP